MRRVDQLAAITFMKRGIVINGLTVDGATTGPVQKGMRDSLITFMAPTTQAQAEPQRTRSELDGTCHCERRHRLPRLQAVVFALL